MFSSETGGDRFHGCDSFLPPDSAIHYRNTSQGFSSPFLPGYLLGDSHSHHHSGPNSRLWSSGTNNSPGQKGVGYPGSVSMAPSGLDMFRREWPGRKIGGPPVKGLYTSNTTQDTLYSDSPGYSHNYSSSVLRKIVSSTAAPPTTGLFHMLGGTSDSSSLQTINQSQNLPDSPVQNSSFLTQGDLSSDNSLDETWVTVFGFPPCATSFILQQFCQYGTILKHIVTPECNWMHIHYLSKIQAKKALSNDGKIYGGCMKIGVTLCTEKIVMEERKSQSMGSMTASSSNQHFGSLTHIRPLTSAYIATQRDYEVFKGKPIPKLDSSLLSKVKEYMFGY